MHTLYPSCILSVREYTERHTGRGGSKLLARLALLYMPRPRQVVPADIPARIQSDPDDDAVLACALAAEAG